VVRPVLQNADLGRQKPIGSLTGTRSQVRALPPPQAKLLSKWLFSRFQRQLGRWRVQQA
jgi:hypothetical protein